MHHWLHLKTGRCPFDRQSRIHRTCRCDRTAVSAQNQLKENTLAQEVYGESDITERHRHRFEFNNAYLEKMEAAGMKASGINPDTGLVEVVEIPEHPWFIGVQYHPEYKSTVANPHPLFVGFVKAVYTHKQKQTNASLA